MRVKGEQKHPSRPLGKEDTSPEITACSPEREFDNVPLSAPHFGSAREQQRTMACFLYTPPFFFRVVINAYITMRSALQKPLELLRGEKPRITMHARNRDQRSFLQGPRGSARRRPGTKMAMTSMTRP